MSDIPTATQTDQSAVEPKEQGGAKQGEQGGGTSWNLPAGDQNKSHATQNEDDKRMASQAENGAGNGQAADNWLKSGHKQADAVGNDGQGLPKVTEGPDRGDQTGSDPVNGAAGFEAVLQRLIAAVPADGKKQPAASSRLGPAIDQFAAAFEKKSKPQPQDRNRTRLAPGEIAERRRISNDVGGIGFGFAKDTPTLPQLKRWYSQLTDKQKQALQNPKARVTIGATCSRPGSEAYNQKLSERRAKNTARALREKMGVKARIHAFGFGESIARELKRPEKQDFHQDRFAQITIEGKPAGNKPVKTPVPSGDRALPGDVDKAAREVGKRGSPPDAPTKYTFDQGMKDWLKDPITSPDKLAQKLGKEYLKQIGDAYKNQIDKVKQGVRTLAVVSALNTIARDARDNRSPHLQAGKPYSAGEFSSRDGLQKKRALADTFAKVNNAHAEKVYDAALKEVADKINPLIQRAQTPDERKRLLSRFSALAFSVIKDAILRQKKDSRRKWGR